MIVLWHLPTILVHTTGNTPTKSKSSQPKSNQHQLTPISQSHDNPNTGETEYNGGQCGQGRGNDRGPRGRGNGGNSDNRYYQQDRGAGRSQAPMDINTDIQPHMNNTHTPNNNNNNINLKCHQLHLNKLQMFVNCVTVRAITIINANLQVISWPAHKKPSIMADHTATKTLIMGTGHMVTMITMTQMGNLFSNGGSRCC